MNQPTNITYVSNAGVLIEFPGEKILIDGLCQPNIPLWKSTPADIKRQLLEGLPPFDRLDTMLYTHHHSDHFDSGSTAEFIKRQPETAVIATQVAVSQLKSHLPAADDYNFIVLNPPLHGKESYTAKGAAIRAISMLHDGQDFSSIQNLAYLIELDGQKVLHLGDAMSIDENYAHLDLLAEEIDLLIASFPNIGIPAHRQRIEKYIRPRKIAVVHLPYREMDEFGWIAATLKSYQRVKNDFIETVFFEEPGDSLIL